MHSLAVAFATLLPLAAQADRDDRRDVVELDTGEVLRGRVRQRFAPDELVLTIGSQDRSIPRAKVKRVHTVDDAIGEFLDLRRHDLTVAADWALAETAASLELPSMARLQAHHILLRDPEHEGAHTLLEHKKIGGKWRWRWDDDLVAASDIPRRTVGKRFTLRTEHFVLESRSGLRAAVDTLFDLERTYTTFWRELGADLHPRSIFAPITVHVHGSHQDMPKLSTTVGEPYCDPSVRGDGLVTTYREATMERAARLSALTVEDLLYRTLLEPRSGLPLTLDQRKAPWIEVGLGRYYESRMTGKPGYVAFAQPKVDHLLVSHVLRYRPYGLENFIHVPFRGFHDDAGAAPHHFAHAAILVTYLMDEKATAGTPPVALRPRFLTYVRQCYREGKGNTSSLLDAALGAEIGRIEKLEAPWIAWLEKTSGQRAIRKEHTLRPRRSLRDTVIPPFIR